MTYRELTAVVLKQKGYMRVSNPGGRGPMRVEVWKLGRRLAFGVGPTLDAASAACVGQLM